MKHCQCSVPEIDSQGVCRSCHFKAEGSDHRLVILSCEATTTGDYQMDNQVDALVEIAINRAMPTIKEMLKQEMLRRFEFTPTKRG